MKTSWAHRFRTAKRQFREDERGGFMALFAVSLVVFLGLIALTFDFGRMSITQTELQSYADSVALAAAGELDGRSDALTRATNAAALIADTQSFGQSNNTLQGAADYTLTFLSALPSDDTAATSAVTTDAEDAVFARVDVVQVNVDFTFAAAFAAMSGQQQARNSVGAHAIAGFTQYACDVTPLMFCLPNPGYTADGNIGNMIHLRAGGQGASWGPGNFGFLDPAMAGIDPAGVCANLSGVQLDICLIGAVGNVGQCFAIRGVDTLPGQRTGIEDALFNVRFDMYHSVMNGRRNNPLYGPAPNVIKGLVPGAGNSCVAQNPTISTDTLGMPRDDCFDDDSCGGNGRFGNGVWTAGRTDYVNTNYGGTDPHPTASSRYQYYLAEIAAAGGASSSADILSGLSENGRPQCSPHQLADPDRRVVIAAGIDCTANPVVGRTIGVPVEEFFRLFMTEPVSNDGGSPQVLEMHLEVVGSAGGAGAGAGDDGGIFRDVVQLYR